VTKAVTKSAETIRLSRLMSRPKITFEKGLIDVDRDSINGYVSDLNNMEINNGAVSKRKGSVVMNDNTEAEKWLLLEEINISGTNLLLCINAKRECYVVSDAYPEMNIKLCKDGFEPIFKTGSGDSTYWMQFKTGDKFWLLDTGRFYIVVSNTGEAYRIMRDGVIRFSESKAPYTHTVPNDVQDRILRSRSTRDIVCYVNIIDATNSVCDGAYSGEVSDPRYERIRGDFRFAYMNDSNVISKFSDTVYYHDYAKRVFSTLPLSKATMNGYSFEGAEEDGVRYIVETDDGYRKQTSFTPNTLIDVDALMFVVRGTPDPTASDWNSDLMETTKNMPTTANGKLVEELSKGIYVVIPRLENTDTTCLGTTTGLLKVSNIESDGNYSLPSVSAPIDSTITSDSWDDYDGSREDFYTEFFGGDIIEGSGPVGTTNPFSEPKAKRTFSASNYNVVSANSYAWQIYKLDVPDSYLKAAFETVTWIVNVTQDDATWDPSDSAALDTTLQHRFYGRILKCSIALTTDDVGANTSYNIPASGARIEGVISDTLIKATNKCGNHWNYSRTTLDALLAQNGLDSFELSIMSADDSVLIPLDTDEITAVTDEQIRRRRLVVWNDGEIVSIAQKGFGQANFNCYDFAYGATVDSNLEGNVNYASASKPISFNEKTHWINNLVKINSPVTWSKNKSITSFPYDIPAFQELITSAKSVVFNAGKVFVVQENKLWIGESGLVLTNPISVDSTIEHMTALYDGVVIFTEKGISRVNGKGKLFKSATRRAKKAISSGERIYFVDDGGMVVRGRLVFSENNVPLIQYDNVSEAIVNIEFGDDPEMTLFDDMLYISDGDNVYRFNDKLSTWDKHISYGKKIRKLSHYDGKLVTFIYDDPDRFNSFYISPTSGGGGV